MKTKAVNTCFCGECRGAVVIAYNKALAGMVREVIGGLIMMKFFNNIRRGLYKGASLIGDANAVQKNTIPARIVRKIATKHMSRVINRLFK